MNSFLSDFWKKFFLDTSLVQSYAYLLFWEQAIKKLREEDSNIKAIEIGWKELDELTEEISQIPEELDEKEKIKGRKQVYHKLVNIRSENIKDKNFSRDYSDACVYAERWLSDILSNVKIKKEII